VTYGTEIQNITAGRQAGRQRDIWYRDTKYHSRQVVSVTYGTEIQNITAGRQSA